MWKKIYPAFVLALCIAIALFATGCVTSVELTGKDGDTTEFATFGYPKYVELETGDGEKVVVKHEPSILNNIEGGVQLGLKIFPLTKLLF